MIYSVGYSQYAAVSKFFYRWHTKAAETSQFKPIMIMTKEVYIQRV
jgi:hypothetical protein